MFSPCPLLSVFQLMRPSSLAPFHASSTQVEYRRALVSSFLFKFFVHVATKLEEDSQVGMSHLNSQVLGTTPSPLLVRLLLVLSTEMLSTSPVLKRAPRHGCL